MIRDTSNAEISVIRLGWSTSEDYCELKDYQESRTHEPQK